MLNFIVNARSGRGRGQRVLKKIINYCYKNNIEYTVHLTSRKGHATSIAKALCENNSHTIVAVGGDGTFHEILNGITTPENTVLGFVPSGRGNDFAKGMGIPLKPLKALEKITLNRVREIDYLEVGGKRCLNVGGTGLDIDVLKRVDGKQGKITYLKSLLYCLFHFSPYKLSAEIDGVVNDFTCVMIAVCNCKQFGGGIKISPLSTVDDGVMDVIAISMPADGKLLKILPKFLKGKHMDMPVTTHFKTDKVKITSDKPFSVQLDGEIYEDLNFEARIIKRGLKTFIVD